MPDSERILLFNTLAFPGANASLVDTLALGNFNDAISDPEMHLKIQQSFNEAVKVAVELE